MRKLFFAGSSFVLVALGIGVGVFAGYRAYEESSRNKRISEEIRLLEEEASRVDQENRKLRDRIEYLQSDSFREQEAKRVLEYRKSGEKVVFIRERPTSSSAHSFGNREENASEPFVFGVSEEREPNYQKWWNLFFDRKTEKEI